MKKILIFDTETNGKPKHYSKAEEDLNNYPHVLQIAGKIIEIDETANDFNPKMIHTFNHLILPIREGKELKQDKEAFKVHNISFNKAFEEGKDIIDVAFMFQGYTNSVDFIIAHNIQFDRNVMASELLRLGITPLAKKNCRAFCTMKYNTPIVKLPNPNYPGTYKFPKLDALYEYYFKTKLKDKYNAHDAMQDVEATTDIVLIMLLTDVKFQSWIKGEIQDIY